MWLESEKIIPDQQIQELDNIVAHAKIFTCGDVEIGHVITSEAINKTTIVKDTETENVVNFAEQLNSDLVTGKYEGIYILVSYKEDNTDHTFVP